MKKIAEILKPGASRKTHFLTASLTWSTVGLLLIFRGLGMFASVEWVLIVIAFVLGTVKALLILDRTAKKNISRILNFQEGSCLGGVYSWKMWLMIIGMIVAGRVLRVSGVAPDFVGVLYVAVGWALFLASRKLWQQYFAS